MSWLTLCVRVSKRMLVPYINRSHSIPPKFLYVNYYENEGASSSVNDIDRYVIIRKLLDVLFNTVLPVFGRGIESR
jgi:hypothetical protein